MEAKLYGKDICLVAVTQHIAVNSDMSVNNVCVC